MQIFFSVWLHMGCCIFTFIPCHFYFRHSRTFIETKTISRQEACLENKKQQGQNRFPKFIHIILLYDQWFNFENPPSHSLYQYRYRFRLAMSLYQNWYTSLTRPALLSILVYKFDSPCPFINIGIRLDLPSQCINIGIQVLIRPVLISVLVYKFARACRDYQTFCIAPCHLIPYIGLAVPSQTFNSM